MIRRRSIPHRSPAAAAAALFAGATRRSRRAGCRLARVTHQAPFAVDACRLFASMITAALAGRDKPGILDAAAVLAALPLREEVARVTGGMAGSRRPSLPASGHPGLPGPCRPLLPPHPDFRSGLDRLRASPGTDPDAALAAYGALAGAFYGEPALPALRGRVADVERLESLADRLLQHSRAVAA